MRFYQEFYASDRFYYLFSKSIGIVSTQRIISYNRVV